MQAFGPKSEPMKQWKRIDGDPNVDDSKIRLDWYNSDLTLEIDPEDCYSARAMSNQGFGYLWSGVRATYGVTKGKVCYEVKITRNNETEPEVDPPHVTRIGWSMDTASLELGTELLSFGYGGTGKASTLSSRQWRGKYKTEKKPSFLNYGKRFGLGDVIGCYLDIDKEFGTISYTLNGEDLGIIQFRVHQALLQGRALYPHIMTKNQEFTVNFGQRQNTFASMLPGYTLIGHLDPIKDGLLRATKGPATKAGCEVLQMVGLPGAGKTYFANNLCKKYPEKRYNILGTNTLIDKMKVMGLTRAGNYSGRWDALITKCTECFNILLKIAIKRKRNYILDQTNVYPTARSRKMKDFKEFSIKTIVVVPNDQEYLRRSKLRAEEEGKEVPQEAILNMKANFVLPDLQENYGQVFYTDLNPKEATELVKGYNQEAFAAGSQMSNGVVRMSQQDLRQRERMRNFEPIGQMWPDSFEVKQENDTPGPSSSVSSTVARDRSRSPMKTTQKQENRERSRSPIRPLNEVKQEPAQSHQPQPRGPAPRNQRPPFGSRNPTSFVDRGGPPPPPRGPRFFGFGGLPGFRGPNRGPPPGPNRFPGGPPRFGGQGPLPYGQFYGYGRF